METVVRTTDPDNRTPGVNSLPGAHFHVLSCPLTQRRVHMSGLGDLQWYHTGGGALSQLGTWFGNTGTQSVGSRQQGGLPGLTMTTRMPDLWASRRASEATGLEGVGAEAINCVITASNYSYTPHSALSALDWFSVAFLSDACPSRMSEDWDICQGLWEVNSGRCWLVQHDTMSWPSICFVCQT